ncbi:hypothetical protein [Saccharothrix sp. ST-888]|uniref:hypothetical protein n=1 Tax=Saccharothrix sp. ST-888 TaxID=1427391 RepID=UPI000ABCD9A0|nr:hypothetical protein [Saccharothrix sp. ST-888]
MTMLGAGDAPCGCGCSGGSVPPCPSSVEDLAVNPFLALRVAFGMLLGEDDFRVLMGNPRGKQMLHSAWLHGPGVVWGLGVGRDGDELRVAPGLAVDGLGRELNLEASWCLSLSAWAADRVAHEPPQPASPECPGEPRKLTGWVVAEFTARPDRPVPALADPCDVTRRHDDFSRVVESVRLSIRPAAPAPWRPFPRVRRLLGLDETGPGAGPDRAAAELPAEIAEAPPHERALRLLHTFRRLAAEDARQAAPECAEGDACPPLLPVTEEHAGVVLAKLSVDVLASNGTVQVGAVTVDQDVRAVILPTTTVQELVCGLAPALLGQTSQPDAGGPRLEPGSVRWSRGNTCLSFCVTAPLADGSLDRSIEIHSLSDHGYGWSTDEVQAVRLTDGGLRVVADLDQAPAYELVRVRIRGTGPTPCYGREPRVPFAGLRGGPPGTREEGHDAVVTAQLTRTDGAGRADA